MIADFSGMIASFATPGVQLRRYNTQTLSATTGRFNTPTFSDWTITACIQRPNGRLLQRLPENQRAEEVIRIDTDIKLGTADPVTGRPADQILYNGEAYDVQAVTDYLAHGNYCQALAVRVGVV
jgi:hypothetical protein